MLSRLVSTLAKYRLEDITKMASRAAFARADASFIALMADFTSPSFVQVFARFNSVFVLLRTCVEREEFAATMCKETRTTTYLIHITRGYTTGHTLISYFDHQTLYRSNVGSNTTNTFR